MSLTHMPIELSVKINNYLRVRKIFKVGEVYEIPYSDSKRGYIVVTAIESIEETNYIIYNSFTFDTKEKCIPTNETKLTLESIKYELHARGLSVNGEKNELITRMWDAIHNNIKRTPLFHIHFSYGIRQKINQGIYEFINITHRSDNDDISEIRIVKKRSSNRLQYLQKRRMRSQTRVKLSAASLIRSSNKKKILIMLNDKYSLSESMKIKMDMEFNNIYSSTICDNIIHINSKKEYCYNINKNIPMSRREYIEYVESLNDI